MNIALNFLNSMEILPNSLIVQLHHDSYQNPVSAKIPSCPSHSLSHLHIITFIVTIYCVFLIVFSVGAEYNHSATKANHPATVIQIPPIQTHAPLICQLLGHSSCAKCRTVTCCFSSIFVRNGRLYLMWKLKIPCWSGVLNEAPKMVALAVLERGFRLMRWKGDNMLNSSWTESPVAGTKGTKCVLEYSEISTVKAYMQSISLHSF